MPPRRNPTWLTPAATILASALAAALASWTTITVQQMQANNAVAVEDRRLKANLILLAMQAPTQDEAIRRLKFFNRAGVLEMDPAQLQRLVAQREGVPLIRPTNTGPGAGAINTGPGGGCKRPVTAEEWRAFQRANKLPQTGNPDAATMAAVEAMEKRCGITFAPSMDFSDPRNSQYLPAL